MSDLSEEMQKDQKYLKLSDGETFKGLYIKWEKVMTNYGKKAYQFTLERQDGSRLEWSTGNFQAVGQISKLIDEGLVKGSPIEITRHGTGQKDTTYEIKQGLSF